MEVKESVQRQFGPVAANYVTSQVHAAGPDLEAMLAATDLRGTEHVLDLGTGTGHTALAFAPRVAQAVAVDLTEPMLVEARRLAADRAITNVTFERGDVERLAYPDDAFDLVTSRYSAHHYPHPVTALREAARVLKPGGTLLLVDVVAPDDLTSDTFLNAIEILRDPSHVRDHTVAQWREMLVATGLEAADAGRWPLRLQFDWWVTRMATPAPTVAVLRSMLEAAPAEVRAALSIEDDGTFTAPVALLVARAASPRSDANQAPR